MQPPSVISHHQLCAAQAQPGSIASRIGQAAFMDVATASGPTAYAAAAATPGGQTSAAVMPASALTTDLVATSVVQNAAATAIVALPASTTISSPGGPGPVVAPIIPMVAVAVPVRSSFVELSSLLSFVYQILVVC